MIQVDSGNDGLSRDLVEAALEECEERTRQAQTQIDHWQDVLARARQEAHLLKELLSLKNGAVLSADPYRRDEFPAGARHRSCERTVELLGESGRPIHISEIMRLLQQEGVELPGAGTQANLISHLTRDARIFRPARGMYGLTGWDIAANLPRPARRRKNRKTRTRTSAKKRADAQ
jgi:hypothetical protein